MVLLRIAQPLGNFGREGMGRWFPVRGNLGGFGLVEDDGCSHEVKHHGSQIV